MKAVDFLAARDYTSIKLKEKLTRAGYPAEEIEAALVKLRTKEYINDTSLCQREFARLYDAGRDSLRQICAKLRSKGFSAEDIAACMPNDTAAKDERETVAALRALSGKYREAVEREKMKAFLYRRGFDVDTCDAAVEQFLSF